jgi:hypothetical protein
MFGSPLHRRDEAQPDRRCFPQPKGRRKGAGRRITDADESCARSGDVAEASVKTRTRNVLALVLVAAALGGALVLAARQAPTRPGFRTPLQAVPERAAIVLSLNLQNLRGSPFAKLLSDASASQGDANMSCGLERLDRVRGAAWWMPEGTEQDFGLAAAGDITPEDLVQGRSLDSRSHGLFAQRRGQLQRSGSQGQSAARTLLHEAAARAGAGRSSLQRKRRPRVRVRPHARLVSTRDRPATRRLMRSPRSPPLRSWSLRRPSLPKLSLRKLSPLNLPSPGRAHERASRASGQRRRTRAVPDPDERGPPQDHDAVAPPAADM